MKKQAFLYNNRFYLFPESIESEEEFISQFAGKTVELTELKEKKCMVPYFVAEHTKASKVRIIKKAQIFPFEAELLTMAEYNLRLREILPDLCRGCPSFGELTPDDSSLKGHHEEAALNGVCFLRQIEEAECYSSHFPVDMWIKSFVSEFGGLELEDMIDGGAADEAEETLSETMADILFPASFPIVLTHNDGEKYRMITPCMFFDEKALVMELVCDALTKKYGDTWEFFNYIPKGYFFEEAKEPVGISIERLTYKDTERLVLTVYTSDDESGIYSYLWLCGLVGENHLRAAVSGYDFVEISDNIPSDITTPTVFADIVSKLTDKIPAEDLIVPYPESVPLIPYDIPEDAPEEVVSASVKYCDLRSRKMFFGFFHPISNGIAPRSLWESEDIFGEHGIPVAQIIFKKPPMESLNDFFSPEMVKYKDKTNLFVEMLKKKNYIKLAGQVISTDAIELPVIVMNLTQLLYECRRLSPILQGIDCELVVFTAMGCDGGRYRISFDMERIESEKDMFSKLIRE